MIVVFGKKQKKIASLEYDREQKTPVIKCSICNGEQVAGLKHLKTGKFEDVMVIRNEKDLELFQKMCGVAEIPKEY